MDDDGFREFVEIRYGDLLPTAYLLTGTRDAAQDLLHTALLKAMRRWRRLDEPVAYVRRILVNERTSRWRRTGSRDLLTATVPDRVRPDATEAVVVRDELLTALQKLPARMRAVLVLRYWKDLSEADTADLLRCSVGTVKSQAARGLTRLREVLASGRDDWPLVATGYTNSADLVAVRLPKRDGGRAVLSDTLLVVGRSGAVSYSVTDPEGRVLASDRADGFGGALLTVAPGTKAVVRARDADGTIASTELVEAATGRQMFGERFVSDW